MAKFIMISLYVSHLTAFATLSLCHFVTLSLCHSVTMVPQAIDFQSIVVDLFKIPESAIFYSCRVQREKNVARAWLCLHFAEDPGVGKAPGQAIPDAFPG